MSEGAEYVEWTEEMRSMDRALHEQGRCEYPCPYCHIVKEEKMKIKTLCKLLDDYDPSDAIKVDKKGNLFIGGKGGYIIKLPITFKQKK